MLTYEIQVKKERRVIGTQISKEMESTIDQFVSLLNNVESKQYVQIVIQNSPQASRSKRSTKKMTQGEIFWNKKGMNHHVIYIYMQNCYLRCQWVLGVDHKIYANYVLAHELAHLVDYAEGTIWKKTNKEKEVYADNLAEKITGYSNPQFRSDLSFYKG